MSFWARGRFNVVLISFRFADSTRGCTSDCISYNLCRLLELHPRCRLKRVLLLLNPYHAGALEHRLGEHSLRNASE